MSDRLLSLHQLADKWGWSIDAVYRLVQKRAIPFVRIGRNFHFRESDVDAWLEAKTVRPPAATIAKTAATPQRRNMREECEDFGIDVTEAFL